MVFAIFPSLEGIQGGSDSGKNIIWNLNHLILVLSAESIELSYS